MKEKTLYVFREKEQMMKRLLKIMIVCMKMVKHKQKNKKKKILRKYVQEW